MNIEALKLSQLGFTSIGLHIKWDEEKQQKQLELPMRWPSATLETYAQYFNKDNNGIAMLTGERNDLYVVDCDVLKPKDRELLMLDGVEAFHALAERYKLPTGVPTARSASGGMHYFFSLSRSLEKGLSASKNTSKIVVSKGLLDAEHDCRSISVEHRVSSIDTRGDGGCIIVAPTSVNGRRYQWLSPLVSREELPAMPDWCIRLINESLVGVTSSSSSSTGDVKATESSMTRCTLALDHVLFIRQTQSHIERLQQSSMSKIWQRTRGYDYALADRTVACIGCSSTHTSNHYMVRGIADGCYWMRNYSSKCRGNVYNWEGHPLLRMVVESPATDTPYTMMLQERYRAQGSSLVYTDKDRFLVFNGTVWEEISRHQLGRDVASVCGQIMDMLTKAVALSQDKDKEKEHAIKVAQFRVGRNYLRKNSNLTNIVLHCRQLFFDSEVEGRLDSNPDLLAVKNGIVDLRTGELREGRARDCMMTQLGTAYEPDGKTDIITAFMDSIYSDDQPTVRYVQKLLGYAITGHTREQRWVIMTGEGGNGKSLLLSILEALMGKKWCVTASYDVFFKNERRVQAGGPTPHLAALKGARICVKEETEPRDKLNIEMLKMITGESTVTARQLYKEEESFTPTALPILLCNHKPAVDVDDAAMMRRILVVPFNNIYTTPDDTTRPFDKHNPRHRLQDPELRARLLTDYAQEQLLTWLVQGAVIWYTEGLGEQPVSMKQAYEAYCDENDKLKLFIDEMCEQPAAGLQKSDAKSFYVNAGEFRERFIEHSGARIMQKDLIDKMARRGFRFTKPRGVNQNVYTGLRMRLPVAP